MRPLYYYTRDHLGSVREMLNSSGTIVARYSYDPYGRTTLVSGSNLATFQYASNHIHATSGLYLTKYRAYDTNTGRWLGRDPAGERGGIDLYEYVDDDPEEYVDRLGLAPRSTVPPGSQIPPLPSGGRKIDPNVPIPPGADEEPPDKPSTPSAIAGAVQFIPPSINGLSYEGIMYFGQKACAKASAHTPNLCKCCVIRMIHQFMPEEEEGSFYTPSAVQLYNEKCEDVKASDDEMESKPHFSNALPKGAVRETNYIPW